MQEVRSGGARRGVFWLLLCHLIWFAPVPARAEGPAGFVGGRADYFVDPGGELDIATIIRDQATLFRQADGRMGNRGVAGNARAGFWLRLRVGEIAGLPTDDWILSFHEGRAREMLLYIRGADGQLKSLSWRKFAEPSTHAHALRYPAIALQTQDISNSVLYVRIATLSSMRANLWLQPAAHFTDQYSQHNMLFGLLFGLIGAVAIYLAAISIGVQNASMGWLSGIAVSYLAYVVGDQAFAETLVGSSGLSVSSLLSFPGVFLLYACSVAFAASYLRTSVHFPRFNRVLNVIVAIDCLLVVVALYDVVFQQRTLRPFSAYIGLFNLLLITVIIVVAALRTWRRAALFALCFAPSIWGGLLRLLPDASRLETSPYILYATFYGIALSLIAFAILASVDLGTRQRRAREALETSEVRLRDYAASANDWFWETNAAGRVTFISQPLAKLLGIGMSDPLLAAASGGGTALHEALSRREPFRRLDFVMPGEGQRTVIEFNGKPVVGSNDAFQGFRGTASDVTGIRSAADARVQQQKMAALGQLAGGVAHEINNLLHPILNLSRHAYESIPESSVARSSLRLVIESAKQAGDIVARILGTVRSDRKSSVVAAGLAVQWAIDAIEPLVPKSSSLNVRLGSQDGPPVSETDMFQVLSNLMLNALHAVANVGTIEVAYEAVPDSEAGPASFKLSVRDDGRGMDNATALRAFEPFFSTKPPGEGTGLGLSIVYSIVQSWHGQIDIESRPGGGTTVTISLPSGGLPSGGSLPAGE